MKMNEMYPSKYLKCEDLKGTERKLMIAKVDMEKVGQEDIKPVVYFRGASKALILNKTNAMVMADGLGDETDSWIGCAVVLKPSRTNFQGKMVDCIRVDVPTPSTSKPGRKAEPAPEPEVYDGPDEPDAFADAF